MLLFFVLLFQSGASGNIVYYVTELGITLQLQLHFTFYILLHGMVIQTLSSSSVTLPNHFVYSLFFGFLLWSLFISSHPHLIWMPYHNSVTLPNHFVFSVFFWFASLEFYYLLQLL